MPTFAGFTTKRYQEHDTLIKTLVNEFNKNKQIFVGGTASQISKIPNLSEALIKSWIIQETGGNDARSLAAWKVKSMFRAMGLHINNPLDLVHQQKEMKARLSKT